MIVIESNANEVFADLLAVIKGIPSILGREQRNFQTAIHWGLTDQFDALGRGEPVPSTDGDFVAWDAISPLTEFIRSTKWHVSPGNPILQVTGSLRQGLTDGSTYIYDYGKESILSYFPSVTQADRIEKHEEGFEVTSPIAAGHRAPARPMLFWGEEMGQEIMRLLERGIDNLARSKGFT
jgi:hypothetical protein